MSIDLEGLIREKRRGFLERRKVIDDASQKAKQDFEGAKKEVGGSTLSKALADAALGKISKAELARVKKQFRDAKQVVEDYPLLLTGLTTEKGEIDGEGAQFALTEQYVVAPYQALKTEILESGLSQDRTDRLRVFAKELSREFGEDCLVDAEDFLKQQGAP
jgi:hypothetical protein